MKRLTILLIAAAALLAPSAALAGGVVLKVQASNHLVAVASTRTHVQLVHVNASARLHVGQRVSLASRKLRNGTFAGTNVRVVGHATSVHFRGRVLAKNRTRLVVSAGGAAISLKRGSRTTSSARDSSPPVGTTVDVTATVGSDDELDDVQTTVVSAATPGGQLEGTLTLGTGTVTVTSEHSSLALKVPTGLDLTGFANGDEVLATFTQLADGSLQLTAIAGDDNENEANSDDGDHGGHDGGGHGDGGGGGGGGGGGD